MDRVDIEGGPAYGDTPARRRTGVSDRQAAGLDPLVTTVHADAYDESYNMPRNGLGTYYETDAAW